MPTWPHQANRVAGGAVLCSFQLIAETIGDTRKKEKEKMRQQAVSMEENTLFLKGKEENCFSSFGIIILSNI